MPAKSSQLIGTAERDHFVVGGVAILRAHVEAKLEKKFPIGHAVYAWNLRRAGWLTNRLLAGRAGLMAFLRYMGRGYNGEICEPFETVLWKGLTLEARKLEDWIHLGLWLGKTRRGDDHLVLGSQAPHGEEEAGGQSSDAQRVDELDALPWQSKPPRVKERRYVPRRKYITRAYVKKYGGIPNCKACVVDGPAHSRVCRDQFEEILKKEREDLEVKVAAEAAAQSAAVQKEAALAEPPPLEAPELTGAKLQDGPMEVPDVPPGSMPGSCSDPTPKRKGNDVEVGVPAGAMSDETPEPYSQKVRRIAGLDVCALSVIGGQPGKEDLSLCSTPMRSWSRILTVTGSVTPWRVCFRSQFRSSRCTARGAVPCWTRRRSGQGGRRRWTASRGTTWWSWCVPPRRSEAHA